MSDPHRLRRLSAGARRDLLRVLTSPSDVRADVIRQFHERGYDGMVETLAELEADELLRLQAIQALGRSFGEQP
jgi:HEAT repeat protein